MATTEDGPVAEAERLLAGAPGPDELKRLQALERLIALSGDADTARRVRARRRAADVALAVKIRRGELPSRRHMLDLAKRLAEYKELGSARRIMKLACAGASHTDDAAIYTELFQKGALYTYKDPDLPAEWRLERALEILGTPENLNATTDPETLGIAGAIYKRKWEVDAQRQHLERALFYYLKGYAQGAPEAERDDVLAYLRRAGACQLDAARDRGYCGINAAFILDLLAQEELEEARRIGITSSNAAARRADARRIREEILRSVPPLADAANNAWLRYEWWFYATIGEAYFGVGRFTEAVEWLTERPRRAGLRVGFDITAPAGLDVPEWEYESTARQLARLARLHGDAPQSDDAFAHTEAAGALRVFLAGCDAALRSTLRGKVGLALSGGGFRASLFHIGTLACLAEHDLLRHVEVLSCVSGGSIIGAHYYLKVRQLLETRCDAHIPREAYVQIVAEIEREFLAGVQRNIRTRVLAELSTNLKMLFCPGYSRTLRVGELYEREIYSRMEHRAAAPETACTHDGLRREAASPAVSSEPNREWFLNDLRIQPCGAESGFHPRSHNWRRDHKVPTLILNAACLNSGHNWQFTASYMGEPPTPINAEIDCNDRLRRMYYEEAPEQHQRMRLGYAVAASSCVPGLFEPLVLDDLYPDRSVRLVDGGVCDNQGIASCLEQDCTVLLVSDGSGQMESELVPSGSVLGVPLRANSILQARVREAQHGDVSARRRTWLLRGLLFVHLKQDLPGEAVAWNTCKPDRRESDFERARRVRDRTSYGVSIATQKKLAAIRTDLDSFNDAEAYALMASAYRMTREVLDKQPIDGMPAQQPVSGWRFLQVDRHLEPEAAGNPMLDRLLAAGSSTAFKVWSLWPPLTWTARVVGVALLIAIVMAALLWPATPLLPRCLTEKLTLGGVVTLIGMAIAARIVIALLGRTGGTAVMRAVSWRETLQRVAIGVGMSVVGWLLARLHLHVFDRLYLRLGGAGRFAPSAADAPLPASPTALTGYSERR